MSNFENQLSRMKALMTYGKIDEGTEKKVNASLEYHKEGADGKVYGIVKECNHYYIKTANRGEEMIVESYQYIGGFRNKGDYEYNSYNNALKQLELKLSSINEAHDNKVNISTLDPFKKETLIAEASDKMRDEIARQRQIMYNAAMIMSESKEYAVKGGNACSTSQPEAETGKKGDEGYEKVESKPEYKGSNVNGVVKKAEPFKENPVNEGCEGEGDFDEGLCKGRDPRKIGWEMEGQTVVKEENDEWGSAGLPSTPGVGEADTDKNNGLFSEPISEGAVDVEGDNEPFTETVNESEEDEFDFGEDDFSEDEFGDELDIEGEDFDVEGDEEIDGEEMPADEFDGEEVEDIEIDSIDGDELEDEVEEVDETDPESIRAEIARLESLLADVEGGEEVEGEDFPESEDYEELDDEPVDTIEGEEEIEGEEMPADDFDDEEVEDEDVYMESRKRVMDSIVESVVKKFINENELHDFGKHPGYRKKPMTLPPTGQDENEHGRDWNDESVYSEQPFGEKIGDGNPYTELVKNVTKDVMSQLKNLK